MDALYLSWDDMGDMHRYRKSLNRLLKVCYVPATRAVLIAFFSSFLLQPLRVLMKQARQLVRSVKQSIDLDVYGDTIPNDAICVASPKVAKTSRNTDVYWYRHLW
jgi:hypothetical protein